MPFVTVMSDGYISVPGDIVTAGADPASRPEVLRRLPTGMAGVKAYANIPIVRTDSETVIFDVGGGRKYQATEGRLVANLEAAGIATSSITKVVFTHAHPDHVWGTQSENGDLAFPNATYYVGKVERDSNVRHLAKLVAQNVEMLLLVLRVANSALITPIGFTQ